MPGTTRILMATFDGEAFLRDQIATIRAQTLGPIALTVSDDGSSDGTLDILAREGTGPGLSIDILRGPGLGATENFRHLIAQAPASDALYAFSDQDDLWHADKLARAASHLSRLPPERPALVCGRTRLIDEAGAPIGHSPLFARPPAFANALVQNIAGGNTMVMNRAAFRLLQESVRRTSFVIHDWWTYLIVTGAGGTVIYDERPAVDYRQHGFNVIGHATGSGARLKRLRSMLSGRYRASTDANLAALDRCADLLTEESRMTLAAFKAARQARGLRALRLLGDARLYRQGRLGTVSLRLGIALGRI